MHFYIFLSIHFELFLLAIDNRKKEVSTQLSAVWQLVGCLLLQASRALALMRILLLLQYRKEMH